MRCDANGAHNIYSTIRFHMKYVKIQMCGMEYGKMCKSRDEKREIERERDRGRCDVKVMEGGE